MERAVLLTGGNLGDVAANLREAARRIAARVGCITARSRVYVSEPWGFEAPERFLNQVLVVETELSPGTLLETVQRIEAELGRERGGAPGYASRTMDIDILFYGNRVISTPRLTVPHPLLHERMFVLEPLGEVLPALVHPLLGRTVAELRADLEDRSERVATEKDTNNRAEKGRD